jgi:chromosome segregation ATPase
MTTQLTTQIINISNKLEDKYGEYYSKQFKYAINDIEYNTDIETTQIVIDLLDLTIVDDHKQSQINALKKDVKILQEDIKILKEQVIKLEIENKELKEENKILKEENKELKREIKELKDDKQKFDALVKLHECNALVNKEFKRLYRIKFNRSKYDINIPNIGDFINDPPTEDDEDNYNFWKEFNAQYPQSDDANFRMIYQQIANNRADYGAHVSVRKLNKTDFDKLIELVYPEEYNTNKELYNEYRDWLFMFPA